MVRRRVMRALLSATVVALLGVTLSCATTGASVANSPPRGADARETHRREPPLASSVVPPPPTAAPISDNGQTPAAPHVPSPEIPEVVAAFPDMEPRAPAAGIEGEASLPLPQPPPAPAQHGTVAPKTGAVTSAERSSVTAGGLDLPSPPAPRVTRQQDSALPATLPQAKEKPRHRAAPAASPLDPAPASDGPTAAGGVAVSVAPPQSPPAGDAAQGSPAAAGTDGAQPAKAKPDAPPAQTVYARPGDQITVALDGGGWIFTGNGDWKNGLQYLSRSLDNKGTTFVFQAETLGAYRLSFLKQDLATGATTTKIVKVSVLSDADFARAIAGAGAAPGSSSPPGAVPGAGMGNGSGNYAQADELYQEGFFGEALAAYKENWAPGNPAINERIANLAFRLKSFDDAKAFWRQNLAPADGVYRELAIAGLMKTAADTHDVGQLRLLLPQANDVTQVPIRSELLAAARFLVENRTYELASKYLNEYLSRYAGQEGADEAYYLLGTMYQDDSPMQDARKARAYYEKITNLYPTSRYYQRAMNSIIYLNRHFFEIR